MNQPVTVKLPDGEVRKLYGLDQVVGFVRELGRDERDKRSALLASRLALGAALIQIESQIPHGKKVEFYERIGVNRKVAAACKRKASQLADDRGELSPDKVKQAQDRVIVDHGRGEFGSRVRKLVTVSATKLTDRQADELVGNRPMPSPFACPWDKTPNESRNVRRGGHLRNSVIERGTGVAPNESRNVRRGGHLNGSKLIIPEVNRARGASGEQLTIAQMIERRARMIVDRANAIASHAFEFGPEVLEELAAIEDRIRSLSPTASPPGR